MSDAQVHEIETPAGTVTTTWTCLACKVPGVPRNRRQTTCGKQACKTEAKRRRLGGPERVQAYCSECKEPLPRTQPRKVCDKAECQKAAQSKRFADWYSKNKAAVSKRVTAHRKAKTENARSSVVRFIATSPTPVKSAFFLSVVEQLCADHGVPLGGVSLVQQGGSWFALAKFSVARALANRGAAVRWDGREVQVATGLVWRLRDTVDVGELRVLHVGEQRIAEVRPHAVDGYIERFRRGVSRELARQGLEALFRLGHRVGPSASVPGTELWRGPREGDGKRFYRTSRLRMVVGPHPAGGLALMTVLPPRGRVSA